MDTLDTAEKGQLFKAIQTTLQTAINDAASLGVDLSEMTLAQIQSTRAWQECPQMVKVATPVAKDTEATETQN